jgi:benzoylformate decarboxylase
MRQIAKRYLRGQLSRRDFVRMSTAAGFSIAAARSAAGALESVARSAGPSTRTFQGTGGELVAEQLRTMGTRFIFVCNSSGMGSLSDAVVDRPDLQFIQAPSEHQTVAIADGFAKATGQPSFVGFSRVGGPLASANMFNAMKDRTPMVVMTDHTDTGADGRDGAEDVDDWLEAFKQYTKWRWIAKEGNRIPEWLAHAFKIASTPPGGPSFLRVPRNVLYQKDLKAEIFSKESISVPMNLVPNPRVIEEAARMLIEADSPVLFLGSEVWTSGGRADVVELAELLAIPATQGWSWAADFPTNHPLYMGGYVYPFRYPKEIDLFINLGVKMPDQGSGPPLVPRNAKIIHGRIDSSQIGINYPTDVAIVGDVKETARSLVQAIKSMATAERLATIKKRRWDDTTRAIAAMRKAYIDSAQEEWDSAPITWPRLLLTLNEMLDEDAVIVEEVGTEDWVLRSFDFADGKKMKIGRTLGRALGWGVGASVGVKLALPDRQVVALQGDGGFLFGQSEALWSMSRYDVPIITVVCNNRSYDEPRNNIFMRGGPSQQQKKDMICYLGSPDVEFSDIARAYGIRGERVNNPSELAPAVQRAITTTREGRPYLLDVRVARTGMAADSTWYPHYSVAAVRTRKV